ncbi:hypothetical protein AVEN_255530-1 [Araneus ventricosus]|uniref:Uncharacterized protein n=1 Tax=Araneus ventricosus TaxID=182803 RepID=A0A4Y2NRR1_ARAVE|nr:hypothetical protein AVEN_255530-1 [Araneus ventricosus]
MNTSRLRTANGLAITSESNQQVFLPACCAAADVGIYGPGVRVLYCDSITRCPDSTGNAVRALLVTYTRDVPEVSFVLYFRRKALLQTETYNGITKYKLLAIFPHIHHRH